MAGAAIVWLLLTASPAPAPPYVLADAVEMASPTSRAKHRVWFRKADLRADRMTAGTLSLPVAGVALEPNGFVGMRLTPRPDASGPYSIAVQLATAPSDHGREQTWALVVGGVEIARITDQDPGAGATRTYFVEAPREWRGGAVEVHSHTRSGCYVTVSSVRLYSRLVPAAEDRAKMGFALLTHKGFGYHMDGETQRELVRMLPRSRHLLPQTAVLYNFSRRTAAENAAEIDRLARLAEQTGIPLRIAFQFHWAGIPSGVPDGAGGTFTDLPYQQITFDPDDQVDDPGLAELLGSVYDKRYGLSVPNVWSNTPWLTFNHPRLNEFRRQRLTQALEAWRAARERLAIAGKGALLPPQLSTGEETVYWAKGVEDKAYTEKNGGKPRTQLMADFNPFTVAAAFEDGIPLDPRNGLDNNERWWLHQNLARWQQTIVNWMLAALPPEPVLPGPKFSADLTRRNIFTEPYAMPLFPMKDVNPRRPGLELGYVREGRSGGEYWSGATMLPWLLKQRERGRTALPNLECTGAGPPQLQACVLAAYACGARFVTLYNWHHTPEMSRHLQEIAARLERPARTGIALHEQIVEGTRRRFAGQIVAPPEAFGVNVLRVPLGPGTPAPLRARLRGPLASGGSAVDVAVVQVPEVVEEEGARYGLLSLPILVHQVPGQTYALTVDELPGPTPTLAARADPMAPNSAFLLAQLISDVLKERGRSLAIQDLQDARDLLEAMEQRSAKADIGRPALQALARARVLLERMQPREAYGAAIEAEQLALPAAFRLPAGASSLQPFAVRVELPKGGATVTVKEYSESSALVSILGPVRQLVRVTFGGSTVTGDARAGIPLELGLVARTRRPSTRASQSAPVSNQAPRGAAAPAASTP